MSVTSVSAVTRPDTFRRSLLQGFEACPRRTLHELMRPELANVSVGNVGASAALGTVLHEVAAEILRTLRRQGEKQMPTAEALEVAYEVLAGGPWVLPTKQRHDLRSLVLRFASYEFDPKRIVAIEDTLTLDLECPDGEVRTLTGTPDLLVADPPRGIVIVDYKSGWSQPKSPRSMPEPGEPITGIEYLTGRGHFQLDMYGLMVMKRYPRVEYVILRELLLRRGEVRQAELRRDELEHVERQIAVQAQLLDRAIFEGPGSALWAPRPGAECARRCPVAKSCPVPAEQRGAGSLDGPESADEAAQRFVVMDAVRDDLRLGLKTYHEQTGDTPRVGDGTVFRWRDRPSGKGREFGAFSPEEAPDAE